MSLQFDPGTPKLKPPTQAADFRTETDWRIQLRLAACWALEVAGFLSCLFGASGLEFRAQGSVGHSSVSLKAWKVTFTKRFAEWIASRTYARSRDHHHHIYISWIC